MQIFLSVSCLVTKQNHQKIDPSENNLFFFYFWFDVRRGEGGGRIREEYVALLSHFSFFSTILQYDNFPINAISAYIKKKKKKKKDNYSYNLLV